MTPGVAGRSGGRPRLLSASGSASHPRGHLRRLRKKEERTALVSYPPPYRGVIERYRERLPVSDETPVATLLEGATPLLRARNLERALGNRAEIHLKYEGANPTGSFKDRGMTLAVSKAVEDGADVVACASTGNTSAAAAAYAARAGIRALVVLPAGNVALGKVSQALMYGAAVVAVKGSFDDALRIVREISAKYCATLVNSINPYRIEGQKTAAFEIVEDLGRAPDFQFMPVGNAGNITAYWRGYREYCEAGRCDLPRMMGYQAEGAAPIVRKRVVERPETLATAIRIGNPASWKGAEAARDESNGVIDMVSDQEILDAYRLVARTEGVFCEPASAAGIAGLKRLCEQGFFDQPEGKPVVVCVLTGHGLKDPERAIEVSDRIVTVEAETGAVARQCGLG